MSKEVSSKGSCKDSGIHAIGKLPGTLEKEEYGLAHWEDSQHGNWFTTHLLALTMLTPRVVHKSSYFSLVSFFSHSLQV